MNLIFALIILLAFVSVGFPSLSQYSRICIKRTA